MTELKGLEGYIAALREPEQWEAWNSGGGWRGNENWRYWNADVCTAPEQRWRRKPMVAEGEVRCISGGEETRVYISLPSPFAGKTVRYRIEEVREK